VKLKSAGRADKALMIYRQDTLSSCNLRQVLHAASRAILPPERYWQLAVDDDADARDLGFLPVPQQALQKF